MKTELFKTKKFRVEYQTIKTYSTDIVIPYYARFLKTSPMELIKEALIGHPGSCMNEERQGNFTIKEISND